MRSVWPIGIHMGDVTEFYRRRQRAREQRDVPVAAYASWPLDGKDR